MPPTVYPQIKLLTIQPVSNTVAIMFDRNKETGYYWYPPHVAIYAVKESETAPQSFEHVYLDNRPANSTHIVTGFCQEDPSLPLVRDKGRLAYHDVFVFNVVYGADFKMLLECVQRHRHGADYVPQHMIDKCRAESIQEDIDFLKEDLILHGVKLSKNVDDFCKEEIVRAEEYLESVAEPD